MGENNQKTLKLLLELEFIRGLRLFDRLYVEKIYDFLSGASNQNQVLRVF